MKTLVRSLVIVIVMILGATTANATIVVDKDIETETLESIIADIAQKKKKCLLNHIHNETCGGKYVVDKTKVYAGMNKKLRRHIYRGHHKYHRDESKFVSEPAQLYIAHLNYSFYFSSFLSLTY